ncbi:MAG: hypothetical protein ACK5B9_06985 [Flavobacteriia bacterium]|jgi:hypothetical protein
MSILKKIIKKFFGKDYEFLWRQFAIENEGIYFSDFGQDKVEFDYQAYKVVFETYRHYVSSGHGSYESHYVRAIVEFNSYDKIKLRITNQGLIDTVAIFFGAQDIQIGDASLDKKYIIKGNDEFKAQLILSDNLIKKFLLENEIIRLEITEGEGLFDEKPQEGCSMLYYISEKKISQIDQLYELKSFITQFVDLLSKHGSVKPIK